MDKPDKLFDQVMADKIRAIPEKARIIETAQRKGRLLAVRGSMDYVDQVAPHVYAAEKVIVDAGPPPARLAEFDVVFIGCPGDLDLSEWGEPLQSFLQNAGVLMTTDWCLQNIVQQLFPKTIKNGGSAQGVFPLRALLPKHPLLEGLDHCDGTPWVVEASSHRIAVLDPKRVEVVLDAPSMGGHSAVLVNFNVGKGLVVHAISHFHLQGSKKSGEYVSAYILTNVVDEAIRRRHLASPPNIRVLGQGSDPASLRIRVTKRG